MSLPLSIANHIVAADEARTVRELCEVFPGHSYKQLDCAAWRAARAGWLVRKRVGSRGIAYAPGRIDSESARRSAKYARPSLPVMLDKPILPEGVPAGIPASVWDLPTHGWPAERKHMNYWPAEAEEHA